MNYTEMVEMLRRLKQAEGFPITESLDSLAQIAESRNFDSISLDEVGNYVWALAAVEEWQRAEAVARSISDKEEQENILFELAQLLAGNNLLDKAEELTLLIEAHYPSSISEKIFTLNKIASCYLKNHQEEQAINILMEAEKSLENYQTKNPTRAWMIDEMAYIWEQLGQKDHALEMWKEAVNITSQSIAEARAEKYVDYDTLKMHLSIIRKLGALKELELAKQIIYKSLSGKWLEQELRWLEALQNDDSGSKVNELSE
jgi:tetratricopeptide (TPR) repeat protein